MKTKPTLVLGLLTAALCLPVFGQGTAFTYQGRLHDGATPANGIYDFRFAIYDLSSGGAPQGNPLTNSAITVSNGLFTVTLDFGAGVFTGAGRWLEIGVCSNGVGAFTALTPRQALTPTPYAIFAERANLGGNYPSAVNFNNGANSFNGSFYGQFFGSSFVGGNFVGNFIGTGSGLSDVWHTGGNLGTTAGVNFLGTTDNQALEVRVNNVRGLRLEPDPRGSDAANLIGGHPANRIEQPNSGGSVIGGGGAPGGENIIRSNSSGAFIGAGSLNVIGPDASDTVIAGGKANTAASYAVAVGGGFGNGVQPSADFATIGGGWGNLIQTNSGYSAIAGGAQNEIQGNAGFSAIGGGWLNKIQITADQSSIAGGNANEIFPGARESFIGGGFANQIRSNAYNSVIGGGSFNVITNAGVATIGGGTGNTNNGFAATVAGGFYNTAIGNGAAVGGGGLNLAAGFNATVGGGDFNQALNANTFIGGGYHNTNSGNAATIAGGWENQATGTYGTVPGGFQNRAGGAYSFASGRQAKAIHLGSFVWADSTAADFFSAANNEFAVRASGGMRVVGPGMTLNGEPVLTTGSTNAITLVNPANSVVGAFTGDGAGLTNLNAWQPGGNTVLPGQFLGSLNNQAVEIRANNQPALRLQDATDVTYGSSPNLVGGFAGNIASNGFVGGTIGGGGSLVGGANRVGNHFATVVGGQNNTASGFASTAMGGDTTASGAVATAMGLGTVASGTWSTALGVETVASGTAAIAMGNDSAASGGDAIAMGRETLAAGTYSAAMGRRSAANHQGTYVWADSQNPTFASSGDDQFLVRATGGVGINTNNPGGAALSVNGNIATSGGLSFSDPADSITFPAVAGASGAMINMFADGTGNATRMVIAHSPAFQTYGLRYLDSADQFEFIGAGSSIMSIGLGSGNVGIGTNSPISKLHVIGGATFSSGAGGANQSVAWSPGSASWSFTSDRNAKDRVAPVNPESVLEKVARLPIHEWSYIGHEQRHIGPMAQDFHAAFPLNDNHTALNDADLHGVALAAIQGLNQKLDAKSAEVESLKTELEQLKQLVNKLTNAQY